MTVQQDNSSAQLDLVAPPRSPLKAIRPLGRAIAQLYNHFFLFSVVSALLWLTLPTVILPSIIVTAMYRLARQAQTSPAPDFSDLWSALRGSLPWGPLLFLSGLAGVLLILFNIWFYNNVVELPILLPLWFTFLAIWLTVGFYSFPIAVVMERPRLFAVLRLAFLFVMVRPLTTLLVWAGVLLLTAITSMLLLLVFFLPALFALWATALVHPRTYEQQEADEENT